MTKVRKFSNLVDESNVQLNENKDDKKTTSIAQVKTEAKTTTKVETKNKTKDDEAEKPSDDKVTDCALNGSGKQVTSHVQQ